MGYTRFLYLSIFLFKSTSYLRTSQLEVVIRFLNLYFVFL